FLSPKKEVLSEPFGRDATVLLLDFNAHSSKTKIFCRSEGTARAHKWIEHHTALGQKALKKRIDCVDGLLIRVELLALPLPLNYISYRLRWNWRMALRKHKARFVTAP